MGGLDRERFPEGELSSPFAEVKPRKRCEHWRGGRSDGATVGAERGSWHSRGRPGSRSSASRTPRGHQQGAPRTASPPSLGRSGHPSAPPRPDPSRAAGHRPRPARSGGSPVNVQRASHTFLVGRLPLLEYKTNVYIYFNESMCYTIADKKICLAELPCRCPWR